MGVGKDGKQPITIDWSVTDPSGKKLGTVSQKNEVPQGSLDGAWGKTADAAAAAAAQGIVKLLPQPTQRPARTSRPARDDRQVTPRQLSDGNLEGPAVYRRGPSC